MELRLELDRPGMVRFDDGVAVEASIVDLTREGCRIATDTSLSPGARFSVGMAHVGRIRARVIWHGPDGYGCAFETPLPPGTVTAAFGGSNVAAFPLRADPATIIGGAVKWSARARLVLLAGAVTAAWVAIVAGSTLVG